MSDSGNDLAGGFERILQRAVNRGADRRATVMKMAVDLPQAHAAWLKSHNSPKTDGESPSLAEKQKMAEAFEKMLNAETVKGRSRRESMVALAGKNPSLYAAWEKKINPGRRRR